MSSQIHLAIDLGASSGRVLAGQFDGQRLELSELHRFWNGPIRVHDRMVWDLMGLWKSVQEGLQSAATQYGDSIASVGVDTWGVDFALLGPGDEILGDARHYRDSRNFGMVEKAFETMPREQIFASTGMQFMEINSLYQLLGLSLQNRHLLDTAETFLMIPDLFHWFLTGEKTNEFSDATTTQMLNPRTGTWAADILDAFQIPDKLFREPTQPGTNLGPLMKGVAESTKLSNVQVIVPGSHDTASAVLAVPAESQPSTTPDWCYVSSGTWSLMGVEVPEPVITDKCAELNFTNEGGVAGTVRLLKNIGGLWLVQECRRVWAEEGREYDWNQLTQLASEATPLQSFVNPDSPELVAPVNMPQAIREICQQSGQPVPETDGAVIRCALESLAMRYRQVLGWLEELTGGSIGTIHIVGGGSQNQQLNQMAANACKRRVVAGPVEATAIGNAAMQAIALGSIESIGAARRIIADSFAVKALEPQEPDLYNEAYAQFLKVST